MCGIVGVAGPLGANTVSSEQLVDMCSQIKYRGPDDVGIGLIDNIGLGMRRLSIIDLAGSKQPMFNEDGDICTVFNGEIYNFQSLRKKLIKAGHKFLTQGDTEVIVHAYEEFGDLFPHVLNGMFAIAIHDTRTRRLHLSRDHLGIKPLYYTFSKGHFIWGSEIKAILASGLVDPQLDLRAVNQFLTWEYVPGDATLFKGIKKLLPGHSLLVDLRDLTSDTSEYWDIPPPTHRKQTDSAWIDEVDSQIRQSVRNQMISDVPLGAFLSGGIDSSLVVAAMGDATTFSIGFNEPSYNELPFSSKVAEHLGVDHHTEVIDADVASLFEKMIEHFDDPIGDFSIFPTYLVSKLARQKVTVALSGDGADEIFGGYDTYVAQDYARIYESVPRLARQRIVEPIAGHLRPRQEKKGLINKFKRFTEGAALPQALGHCRWRLFLDSPMRSRLFAEREEDLSDCSAVEHIFKLFEKGRSHDAMNRAFYVDVKSYLCDNILTKVDRTSMAVSLETRVPLIDRDLVELAFEVPSVLKVSCGKTKILLKQVAARHVPKECVYRQKEGFSIPMKTWLGTQFLPILEEYLHPRRIRGEGLFDSGCIENLKKEHFQGRANHSHLLWSLIVFEAWRDRWLKSQPLSVTNHKHEIAG